MSRFALLLFAASVAIGQCEPETHRCNCTESDPELEPEPEPEPESESVGRDAIAGDTSCINWQATEHTTWSNSKCRGMASLMTPLKCKGRTMTSLTKRLDKAYCEEITPDSEGDFNTWPTERLGQTCCRFHAQKTIAKEKTEQEAGGGNPTSNEFCAQYNPDNNVCKVKKGWKLTVSDDTKREAMQLKAGCASTAEPTGVPTDVPTTVPTIEPAAGKKGKKKKGKKKKGEKHGKKGPKSGGAGLLDEAAPALGRAVAGISAAGVSVGLVAMVSIAAAYLVVSGATPGVAATTPAAAAGLVPMSEASGLLTAALADGPEFETGVTGDPLLAVSALCV